MRYDPDKHMTTREVAYVFGHKRKNWQKIVNRGLAPVYPLNETSRGVPAVYEMCEVERVIDAIEHDRYMAEHLRFD